MPLISKFRKAYSRIVDFAFYPEWRTNERQFEHEGKCYRGFTHWYLSFRFCGFKKYDMYYDGYHYVWECGICIIECCDDSEPMYEKVI